MSDPSDSMQLLSDDGYRRYAGTCRNCGYPGVWVAGDMETLYADFYRMVRGNMFPAFIAHCDGCENQAVFNLTALSADR